MIARVERIVTSTQVAAFEGDLIEYEKEAARNVLRDRVERLGFTVDQDPEITVEESTYQVLPDLAQYTVYRIRGTLTAKTRHIPMQA